MAAIIGICAITVYTLYGNTQRSQVADAAKALAGLSGSGAARGFADAAADAARTRSGLDDFARGSPYSGDGSGNSGSSGNSSDGSGEGNGDSSTGDEADTSAPTGDDGSTSSSGNSSGSSTTTSESPPSPLNNPAIQNIIAKSPTLQSDLARLKEWDIIYDSNMPGAGRTLKGSTTILINSKYQDNPLIVVGILAHEVGHALDERAPDWSSEDAYVQSKLLREGEATLYNVKIRKEILNTDSRTTIPISSGNSANRPVYERLYDNVKNGVMTHEAARQEIANIYKTSERVGGRPYEQHYRNQYNDPKNWGNRNSP